MFADLCSFLGKQALSWPLSEMQHPKEIHSREKRKEDCWVSVSVLKIMVWSQKLSAGAIWQLCGGHSICVCVCCDLALLTVFDMENEWVFSSKEAFLNAESGLVCQMTLQKSLIIPHLSNEHQNTNNTHRLFNGISYKNITIYKIIQCSYAFRKMLIYISSFKIVLNWNNNMTSPWQRQPWFKALLY